MSKITTILFDFDQTIAFLGESHFISLNEALSEVDSKFIISHEEQMATFEGLATRKKLDILVKDKGFPKDKIEQVFNRKQELTVKAIQNTLQYSPPLVSIFSRLKQEGFVLFVVSNAIRATLDAGLTKLGVIDFFDKIISNEDVKNTKPHPEIYLLAMVQAGSKPSETLIVEDSKTGRHAAAASGAHVCDVDSPNDVTYENIKSAIDKAEKKNKPIAWPAKQTLNVLLPCAGAGSRLRAKYLLPKPLIDIMGKTMIQRVVENLNIDANYIFIVQKEHYEQYNLGAYLKLIVPNCTIIQTDGLTEGAACTSLLAKELINNDQHLLIANSDQLMDWDSSSFMYNMISSKCDGGILTFEKNNDPKWSYVKLNEEGHVVELAEKKPISNKATVGIYYWNKGSEYVESAEKMIAANDRSKGEFYVAPSYNYMIKDGKKVITYDIDPNRFYPTGTIDDLEFVLSNLEFKD